MITTKWNMRMMRMNDDEKKTIEAMKEQWEKE